MGDRAQGFVLLALNTVTGIFGFAVAVAAAWWHRPLAFALWGALGLLAWTVAVCIATCLAYETNR